MNVKTVTQSLRNTIKSNQALLELCAERADYAVYPKCKAYEAKVEVLEMVITQLEEFLAELESA